MANISERDTELFNFLVKQSMLEVKSLNSNDVRSTLQWNEISLHNKSAFRLIELPTNVRR